MGTYFFVRAVFIAMLCSAAGVVDASETIRVAIADNIKTVALQADSGLHLMDGSGDRGRNKMTVSAASLGTGRLRVLAAAGGAPVQVNGKGYRGTIEVRKKANGLLLVINELGLEDYLKGVVAAEIPHDWELEALKAQAVASRTYALYEKGNAGGRAYHILATTDSQMYLGVRSERPRAVRAVNETRGLVIVHGGRVISAFYHSSCGGHTEDARELWGLDAPYLHGVDCDCQRISAYGLWEKRFSIASVQGALRREGYRLDGVTNVEAGDITPAGRVKNVLFRNGAWTLSVPAETVRLALGYSRIPSIFFEPELSGSEFVFSGRGLGHGVGLCQWGAQEMAKNGGDFRAILAHYYPGTSVARRE